MKNLITKEGKEFVKNKIKELKYKEKPQIINELKKSRKLGDLSENSEYHSAKNSLLKINKKIKELELFILKCKIINPLEIKNKELINFSATIKLKNLDNNKIFKYQIVSNEEINMKKDSISIESPLARILIGKKINEIINIKKINKIIKYQILSIEYL